MNVLLCFMITTENIKENRMIFLKNPTWDIFIMFAKLFICCFFQIDR